MENELKIVKDILHDRDSLSERDFQAIEKLVLELEWQKKENLILKYQELPYLQGMLKGYQARIDELKKENNDLREIIEKKH